MLTEISHFDSLGDYLQIKNLLTMVTFNKPRKFKEVEDYYLYKNDYNKSTIKCVISFLIFIKVLEYKNKFLLITPKGIELKRKLENKEEIQENIIDMIFHELIENKLLLTSGKIKYDSNRDIYIIKNTDFPLKYSNIRNMLIKLGFLYTDKYSLNNLIINNNYLYILKNYLSKVEHRMSLTKLEKLLEVQKQQGEEAEIFVLNYEIRRLKMLACKNKIKRISNIDVQAGYDIISFNSIESDYPDRFIEVKSYNDEIEFYWTKNELETSKQKKENYYIYLIDRSKMNSEEYIPYIIQNPYNNIYCNNNWIKNSQIWHIRPLNL